ncbi:MAG: hypothetical protein ABJE95_15240 [Byssovorax sp.]
MASSSCAAVLGLDDFKEGGAGGATSSSSVASTGGSIASSTTTTTTSSSSTTGAGGGCPSGQMDCDGSCVTLATDPLNCGKCNKACDPLHPGASACVGSICQVCAAGMADCDGLGINACESDLSSDKKNCGVCGHVCAGSCGSGHCEPAVLAATQPFVNSMILQGGQLYLGTNKGTLVAVAVDGSGVKDIASGQGVFTYLALDAKYGYWFISVGANLGIARGLLSGGNVVDNVVTLPAGTFESGLAVDVNGVYVTDSMANKVVEYNFVTTALQDIAVSQPFASTPIVVGTDLVWSNFTPGAIMKKALPVGGPAVLCGNSGANQMIASSKELFFNGIGGLSTVPINGANSNTCPTVLSNSASATSLATDGVTLYWTDNVDGTIKSIPVGGGMVTTVGSTGGTAIGLAVDDKYLYWQFKQNLDIMKLEKNP